MVKKGTLIITSPGEFLNVVASNGDLIWCERREHNLYFWGGEWIPFADAIAQTFPEFREFGQSVTKMVQAVASIAKTVECPPLTPLLIGPEDFWGPDEEQSYATVTVDNRSGTIKAPKIAGESLAPGDIVYQGGDGQFYKSGVIPKNKNPPKIMGHVLSFSDDRATVYLDGSEYMRIDDNES